MIIINLDELRPNQIITTFGPGSVVDAVKDSVTILDIYLLEKEGTKNNRWQACIIS